MIAEFGVIPLSRAPRGARVIVCGGRDYWDFVRAYAVLDELGPMEIAQGLAQGADKLARAWASARGVPCRGYRAWWNLHGKGAGVIRNRNMLKDFKPDGTVAFPGGRGTAHMVEATLDAGRWVVLAK